MKKIIMLILVLLILAISVYANSMTDTLEEGEKKTYELDGKKYNLWFFVEDSSPETVSIFIDDKVIKDSNGQGAQFKEGEIAALQDGATIKIIDLINNPGAPTGDLVNFLFQGTCGNNICGNDETCFSCSEDCGCNSGYVCENKVCVEAIECGDNKCTRDESCEKDNCCDGFSVDLKLDKFNCGKCDNKCQAFTTCLNGKCIPICGDNFCHPDELETCNKDCPKKIIEENKKNVSSEKILENITKGEPTIEKRISQEPKQEVKEEGFFKKLWRWILGWF